MIICLCKYNSKTKKDQKMNNYEKPNSKTITEVYEFKDRDGNRHRLSKYADGEMFLTGTYINPTSENGFSHGMSITYKVDPENGKEHDTDNTYDWFEP
jgi:hypothetical protein